MGLIGVSRGARVLLVQKGVADPPLTAGLRLQFAVGSRQFADNRDESIAQNHQYQSHTSHRSYPH